MKISVKKDLLVLGIDTSGEYCSAGLVRGEQTLGEISKHGPQDHSRLLISFIDKILKKNSLKARDIGAIAVSIGPGSFTGLRVGVATAKALAQELGIPVVGIPTLDVIALNTVASGQCPVSSKRQEKSPLTPLYERGEGGGFDICVITDARRQQVYASAYKIVSSVQCPVSRLKKIMKDTVLSIDDLLSLLITDHSPHPFAEASECRLTTVFIGNGIRAYGDRIKEKFGEKAVLAPEELWRPRAGTIALEGFKKLQKKKTTGDLYKLQPVYLREPDIRIKSQSVIESKSHSR